jgi:hypothetical protein
VHEALDPKVWATHCFLVERMIAARHGASVEI